MSTPAHLTDCGLPGIREIPYGIHMCQFYQTRADLAAALVPYFAAGMRKRERCIWITAEPLDAAGAQADLRKAGLDVDGAMRDGSLVIRDYSTWYAEGARLKGAEVLELWLEEERRALAAGYTGLRITGNTSFLRPEDFPLFMEYEALIDHAFADRRIVTLCSYLLDQLRAVDVLEVAHRHNANLTRSEQDWQLISRI